MQQSRSGERKVECNRAGFGTTKKDPDSMQWEKINMQLLLILTYSAYPAE